MTTLTERQIKGWTAHFNAAVAAGETSATTPEEFWTELVGAIGDGYANKYEVDVAPDAPDKGRIEAVIEAVRSGKISVSEFEKLEALAAAEVTAVEPAKEVAA